MENLNTIETEADTIRIYVADLAAYNSGYLHGVWIDATADLETMQDQVNAMLETSPIGFAEEYAIHDYEGFGKYTLEEYAGLELAHETAIFIQEHGEVAIAALEYNSNLEEAKSLVEDNYHGCYDSEEEYAEQLLSDCYDIPDHLANYIDYKRVARDLFCDGYFSAKGDNYKVHVFSY
ncbi:MAG: antirestriction protein ArdA [Gammaproteobacteria bacterium]|nr:antirestriction protein ArdA [Gammaproteobacteria bacterium]